MVLLRSWCGFYPTNISIHFLQPDMPLNGSYFPAGSQPAILLPHCACACMHACIQKNLLQGFLYCFCWLSQISYPIVSRLHVTRFSWVPWALFHSCSQGGPIGRHDGANWAAVHGHSVMFNQWSRTTCHRFLNLPWPSFWGLTAVEYPFDTR